MRSVYKNIFRPLLFRLPSEKAHEWGAGLMRFGLRSQTARKAVERHLATRRFGTLKRFGLEFSNPLGVAAGFDKNGVLVDQLSSLGFGFVEVGTVTIEPQPGNAKPRLFRLPADGALINRMGFNNDGASTIAKRLKKLDRKCVVGVNIGKNKEIPLDAATENYLQALKAVHASADYIAINVSSPNTPDLRRLQERENLDLLLRSLQAKNDELGLKPLLLKISPDVGEEELESIVESSLNHRIAGLIATNTTIARSGLNTLDAKVRAIGDGGLSGHPVAKRSTEVVSSIYRVSKGQLPIIGVGGIFDAQDAFEKVQAGACLLQAYTGFVYSGITFARDVNSGLADIIERNGYACLDEAVGSGHV